MRVPRFWRRQRRDDELTRELESYLAHEIDARVPTVSRQTPPGPPRCENWGT